MAKGCAVRIVLIVLTLLWPASIFAQDADRYLKPYQPNAYGQSATERGAFMSLFGNSREASIRVTKIRFKDGRHATPGIYDEIYFSTKRDSAC